MPRKRLNANPRYVYPHPDDPSKLVSRQRVLQILWRDEGRCMRCGKPRGTSERTGKPIRFCDACNAKFNAWQRQKMAAQRTGPRRR